MRNVVCIRVRVMHITDWGLLLKKRINLSRGYIVSVLLCEKSCLERPKCDLQGEFRSYNFSGSRAAPKKVSRGGFSQKLST